MRELDLFLLNRLLGPWLPSSSSSSFLGNHSTQPCWGWILGLPLRLGSKWVLVGIAVGLGKTLILVFSACFEIPIESGSLLFLSPDFGLSRVQSS